MCFTFTTDFHKWKHSESVKIVPELKFELRALIIFLDLENKSCISAYTYTQTYNKN